ncbi:hypothetical protein TSTA_023440 [Talaromyces stipitatus ATCC 10500]|uniref:Uncharacterized protein n=1 Tax=Talaromyces stipitatus (strain ATCC 10500 / CBS 375.48 / QM 6759 / NRRL 1006) TaxID=441959 RepID=B8M609_TALSN|nr:uncharacterized protein TSTA_023440 [Talaromyces stipitatus ATCC 10500]EED19009.1 hypothetical protein TSTA_023440 [Talaromyces stipitatus ATCC 10500]
MLRDAALSYYWDNIDLWIVQGKDLVEEIITYFEGPEHQQSIKTEWSATTLATLTLWTTATTPASHHVCRIKVIHHIGKAAHENEATYDTRVAYRAATPKIMHRRFAISVRSQAAGLQSIPRKNAKPLGSHTKL